MVAAVIITGRLLTGVRRASRRTPTSLHFIYFAVALATFDAADTFPAASLAFTS